MREGLAQGSADAFERISVGAKASFTHQVSAADIDAFGEISGDRNPIHVSDESAREAGFRGRVAHGMLGAAFLSRVIGTMLPGPGSVWVSQSFRFLGPVYVGDRIEVVVEVMHKSEATRWLVLKTEIVKNGAQKVVTGEAKVMVPLEIRKMELKEMVAIVTGGGRGIGAAIARRLGEQGVGVAVNFLSGEATAHQVAKETNARGGRGFTVRGDVTRSEDVRHIFESTVREWGQVDIIVNNATPPLVRKPILEVTYADFVPFLETYVKSSLELCQLAIPGMKERRFGRIVNVVTSAVWGVPPPNLAPYVSAKSALLGLSKAMAVELGPFGITVNMVSPSLVATDLTSGAGAGQEVPALRHPLRRMARPEDVADAVLFLVGDQGAFVNGANIPVAGGEVMA